MRLIRVFPRRTKATPCDDLAYVGYPDLFAYADQVDISVTFTYDIPYAEELAKAWKDVASVNLGGPAYNDAGGEFEPGKYLKPGYVITSRGCPNHCWFCSVWKRDGKLKELKIKDGWIIQDDNLLACSETHIRDVFSMLQKQAHRPEFTGGIEARLLKMWHVDLFLMVNPKQIFFAYDDLNDRDPLHEASKLLTQSGIIRKGGRIARCYNLIGFPGDTIDKADARLKETLELGFIPMAMLYRDQKGVVNQEWKKFQRIWARPALIYRLNHMEDWA